MRGQRRAIFPTHLSALHQLTDLTFSTYSDFNLAEEQSTTPSELTWLNGITSLKSLTLRCQQGATANLLLNDNLVSLVSLVHIDTLIPKALGPQVAMVAGFHCLRRLQRLTVCVHTLMLGQGVLGLVQLPKLHLLHLDCTAFAGNFSITIFATLAYNMGRERPSVLFITGREPIRGHMSSFEDFKATGL